MAKILVKEDGTVELPLIHDDNDFRLKSNIFTYVDVPENCVEHLMCFGKDYVRYSVEYKTFDLIPAISDIQIDDSTFQTI